MPVVAGPLKIPSGTRQPVAMGAAAVSMEPMAGSVGPAALFRAVSDVESSLLATTSVRSVSAFIEDRILPHSYSHSFSLSQSHDRRAPSDAAAVGDGEGVLGFAADGWRRVDDRDAADLMASLRAAENIVGMLPLSEEADDAATSAAFFAGGAEEDAMIPPCFLWRAGEAEDDSDAVDPYHLPTDGSLCPSLWHSHAAAMDAAEASPQSATFMHAAGFAGAPPRHRPFAEGSPQTPHTLGADLIEIESFRGLDVDACASNPSSPAFWASFSAAAFSSHNFPVPSGLGDHLHAQTRPSPRRADSSYSYSHVVPRSPAVAVAPAFAIPSASRADTYDYELFEEAHDGAAQHTCTVDGVACAEMAAPPPPAATLASALAACWSGLGVPVPAAPARRRSFVAFGGTTNNYDGYGDLSGSVAYMHMHGPALPSVPVDEFADDAEGPITLGHEWALPLMTESSAVPPSPMNPVGETAGPCGFDMPSAFSSPVSPRDCPPPFLPSFGFAPSPEAAPLPSFSHPLRCGVGQEGNAGMATGAASVAGAEAKADMGLLFFSRDVLEASGDLEGSRHMRATCAGDGAPLSCASAADNENARRGRFAVSPAAMCASGDEQQACVSEGFALPIPEASPSSCPLVNAVASLSLRPLRSPPCGPCDLSALLPAFHTGEAGAIDQCPIPEGLLPSDGLLGRTNDANEPVHDDGGLCSRPPSTVIVADRSSLPTDEGGTMGACRELGDADADPCATAPSCVDLRGVCDATVISNPHGEAALGSHLPPPSIPQELCGVSGRSVRGWPRGCASADAQSQPVRCLTVSVPPSSGLCSPHDLRSPTSGIASKSASFTCGELSFATRLLGASSHKAGATMQCVNTIANTCGSASAMHRRRRVPEVSVAPSLFSASSPLASPTEVLAFSAEFGAPFSLADTVGSASLSRCDSIAGYGSVSMGLAGSGSAPCSGVGIAAAVCDDAEGGCTSGRGGLSESRGRGSRGVTPGRRGNRISASVLPPLVSPVSMSPLSHMGEQPLA